MLRFYQPRLNPALGKKQVRVSPTKKSLSCWTSRKVSVSNQYFSRISIQTNIAKTRWFHCLQQVPGAGWNHIAACLSQSKWMAKRFSKGFWVRGIINYLTINKWFQPSGKLDSLTSEYQFRCQTQATKQKTCQLSIQDLKLNCKFILSHKRHPSNDQAMLLLHKMSWCTSITYFNLTASKWYWFHLHHLQGNHEYHIIQFPHFPRSGKATHHPQECHDANRLQWESPVSSGRPVMVAEMIDTKIIQNQALEC